MGKSTIYRWFIDDFPLRSAFYRGVPSHVFAVTPCRSSFAPWPQRQWAGVHGKRPSRCRRWRWRPSPVSDGATSRRWEFPSSWGTPMTEPPAGARSLISRTWRIWSIWSLPGAHRKPLMKWCPLVLGMLILLSHSGTRANVASSVVQEIQQQQDGWIGG